MNLGDRCLLASQKICVLIPALSKKYKEYNRVKFLVTACSTYYSSILRICFMLRRNGLNLGYWVICPRRNERNGIMLDLI